MPISEMPKNVQIEKMRERIFDLLDRNGKMQSELADYLGVTRYVVNQWKRGASSSFVRAEYVQKMAEFFKVSSNYILCLPEDADNKELNEYLSELKNRPEMRTLFKTAKGATKEDVEQAVKIIEALKK